jgi:hypothetical protein
VCTFSNHLVFNSRKSIKYYSPMTSINCKHEPCITRDVAYHCQQDTFHKTYFEMYCMLPQSAQFCSHMMQYQWVEDYEQITCHKQLFHDMQFYNLTPWHRFHIEKLTVAWKVSELHSSHSPWSGHPKDT